MKIKTCLCFGFLLTAVGALADTVLPSAFYTGFVTSNASLDGHNGFNSSTPDPQIAHCGVQQVCASVAFTNTPTMSLSGTALAFGFQDSLSFTSASYSYEILGPPGLVIIQADTNLSVSVTGALPGTIVSDFAYVQVNGESVNNFATCTVNNANCLTGSRSDSLLVQVQTGKVYSITLTGHVEVDNRAVPDGPSLPFGTAATTFADPILSFAPGFDSTGYSILLSPGVSNGGQDPGVPEPGTLGMLGVAGITLAGLRLRWHRVGQGR